MTFPNIQIKDIEIRYLDLVEYDYEQNFAMKYLPLELTAASEVRKKQYLALRHLALSSPMLKGCKELLKNGDQGPLWPAHVIGSFSHSKSMALCALASRLKYEAIGVDIELIVTQKKFEVIKRSILRESEMKMLDQFQDKRGLILATLFFSAKEALYKMLNPLVKVYINFHEAYILEVDQEKKLFTIVLESQKEELKNYNGHYKGLYDLDRGHVMSILYQEKNSVQKM